MATEIGVKGSERYPGPISDWIHTGTQAAAATWNADAVRFERDQVAEIEYIEIFSPVKADGTIEDLKQVIPTIDGKGIEEYISLSGRYDSNMMPARMHTFSGPAPLQGSRAVFAFGEPLNSDPLRNTTLKAKKSISVRTIAGGTDVTADYRIRAYGYLYNSEAEIREVFGDTMYGAESAIEDINRGRRLAFTKDAVDVTIANFDMLSGGVRQAKPQVMPFTRYAYTANDTSPSVNYEFNYEAGDVDDAWENMYFDYGVSDALLVRGVGVRESTTENLKYMGIKLGDSEYPKPDLYHVMKSTNPLHFGHGQPLFPADFPLFVSMPTLKYGYLINNEKGRIIVKDNGTLVAAGDIIAAMHGISVALP